MQQLTGAERYMPPFERWLKTVKYWLIRKYKCSCNLVLDPNGWLPYYEDMYKPLEAINEDFKNNTHE